MNWLMDKLGYVSKKEAAAMFGRYRSICEAEVQEIVDLHGMQAAWSQVKLEHKQRRYH